MMDFDNMNVDICEYMGYKVNTSALNSPNRSTSYSNHIQSESRKPIQLQRGKMKNGNNHDYFEQDLHEEIAAIDSSVISPNGNPHHAQFSRTPINNKKMMADSLMRANIKTKSNLSNMKLQKVIND